MLSGDSTQNHKEIRSWDHRIHAKPSKLSQDTKLMFHDDEEMVGKLVIEKLRRG